MTRIYGAKPAAAIFQKTMENLIKQVLSMIQMARMRLNSDKCEFSKEKISYLGFDIDENGLTKNKDRIKSVLNARKPTIVSELRAFIGMVNYHSKFIAKFA